MKTPLRCSALLISIIAVSAVGLFLCYAAAKQRRASSRNVVVPSTPIYTTRGFTFPAQMDGGTGGSEPGQAWQLHPVGSHVPVDDRQWVAAYEPQTLYLTMRQPPGTGRLFFFKSPDAGKTFVPAAANPLTTIVSREGNLVVDPYNGNLYTTFTTSGATNQVSLLRSLDGGNTWSTIPIYTGPVGTDLSNACPMLAADRDGNLPLAFAQSTGISPNRTSCHVYLMSTANPAALIPTWTTPSKSITVR